MGTMSEAVTELYEKGDYAGAANLAEQAIKAADESGHGEDLELAQILMDLGRTYQAQAQYVQAQVPLARALRIRERLLGPEHRAVAEVLHELGMTAYFQKEFDKAEAPLRRAIAIWEKTVGADHPDFAVGLGNLAIVRMALGDYEGAERLNERTLAIREKALGPDHPDVAGVLHNLACIHAKHGRRADAVRLHERALQIRERAYGPDHPLTVETRNSLAAVGRPPTLWRLGKTPTAGSCLEEDPRDDFELPPGVPEEARPLLKAFRKAQGEDKFQKLLGDPERILAGLMSTGIASAASWEFKDGKFVDENGEKVSFYSYRTVPVEELLGPGSAFRLPLGIPEIWKGINVREIVESVRRQEGEEEFRKLLGNPARLKFLVSFMNMPDSERPTSKRADPATKDNKQ
jgi:tetratricopeptide (TPR) repeat protein